MNPMLNKPHGFMRIEYVGSNDANASGSSSKFWEVAWNGDKCWTNHGRIGSAGLSTLNEGTRMEGYDILLSKLRKGYDASSKQTSNPKMKALLSSFETKSKLFGKSRYLRARDGSNVVDVLDDGRNVILTIPSGEVHSFLRYAPDVLWDIA